MLNKVLFELSNTLLSNSIGQYYFKCYKIENNIELRFYNNHIKIIYYLLINVIVDLKVLIKYKFANHLMLNSINLFTSKLLLYLNRFLDYLVPSLLPMLYLLKPNNNHSEKLLPTLLHKTL